jgi:CoA:oxalate CoA-transferase
VTLNGSGLDLKAFPAPQAARPSGMVKEVHDPH